MERKKYILKGQLREIIKKIFLKRRTPKNIETTSKTTVQNNREIFNSIYNRGKATTVLTTVEQQ